MRIVLLILLMVLIVYVGSWLLVKLAVRQCKWINRQLDKQAAEKVSIPHKPRELKRGNGYMGWEKERRR